MKAILKYFLILVSLSFLLCWAVRSIMRCQAMKQPL
ncbi:Uncharacterised protein [Actinobacillus equuli]|nr:Uncharacterised protein [Actinobacillus equuli]